MLQSGDTIPGVTLVSATVSGPIDADGKVPVALAWTPPPTPEQPIFGGSLFTSIVNAAGNSNAGETIAVVDEVFTKTSATARVPAGSGVVGISIAGHGYLSNPFEKPPYGDGIVYLAPSNVISVDVDAAPAGTASFASFAQAKGHGKGHK